MFRSLEGEGVEGKGVMGRRVEGNSYPPLCLDIYKIK